MEMGDSAQDGRFRVTFAPCPGLGRGGPRIHRTPALNAERDRAPQPPRRSLPFVRVDGSVYFRLWAWKCLFKWHS